MIDLEKNPLRPLIVTRVGGVDLALPVVGKADGLQLGFEFCDVIARGQRGMLTGLDGILLGGETKSVPAHGMEDVAPAESLVPRDNVRGRITFRVSHVQTGAARVGKHVEHVEFWLGGIEILLARVGRMESLLLLPNGLPFGVELIEGIGLAAFAHESEREGGRIRNTGKREITKSFVSSAARENCSGGL